METRDIETLNAADRTFERFFREYVDAGRPVRIRSFFENKAGAEQNVHSLWSHPNVDFAKLPVMITSSRWIALSKILRDTSGCGHEHHNFGKLPEIIASMRQNNGDERTPRSQTMTYLIYLPRYPCLLRRSWES